MRGVVGAGNLPRELNSFVGRQREVAEVRQALTGSRLVTLVGVGGVGKTRLALRAAAESRRTFRDGVWLVELDQISDEVLVVPTVARTLGLREQAGVSLTPLLATWLADRQLLLVVDNCEHLLHATAKLTEALLRDTSTLRILATSREPLGIGAETTLAVAPLQVPGQHRSVTLTRLARYAAVSLFLARADLVVPGFALTEANRAAVVEICSRMEGLPLAIELAAARLRTLSPEQIRDRLTDQFALLTRGARAAPTRQQTLHACLGWSYQLCTRAEQRLWARLSVFAGTIDPSAAEGVCADNRLAAEDLPQLMAFLVDKSVLTRQGEQTEEAGGLGSFRMLDSIRSYGRDRLAETDEDAALLRRRHLDWHQHLARQAREEWIGPRQRDWVLRLDAALPDLRAALKFSLTEPGKPEAALRIIDGLQMYWTFCGLQSEARHWIDRTLAHLRGPTLPRLRALSTSAVMASALGDVPAATALAQQARQLADQLGDVYGHALVRHAEAQAALTRGDLARATVWAEEALGVFRAEDDVYRQAVVLQQLTLIRLLLGDTDGAAAHHASLLELCQPRGESWFSGFTTVLLGMGRWRQGDLDGAAATMVQAVSLIRRTEGTYAVSWCLEILAWIAADRGQPRTAATLLGAIAALTQAMGSPALWPNLRGYHERCEQRTRHALGEQAFQEAFAHGHGLPVDEALAYGLGEHPDPSRAPTRATTRDSPPGAGPDLLAGLTRRQREIASLLAEGLTNQQIADRLVISRRTVEGHLHHIMNTLGVTSRTQVVARIIAGQQ